MIQQVTSASDVEGLTIPFKSSRDIANIINIGTLPIGQPRGFGAAQMGNTNSRKEIHKLGLYNAPPSSYPFSLILKVLVSKR